MTELEAVETLRGTELVAVAQGNLGDIKELQGKCLDADIPALAARQDKDCRTKSCGTSLRLMIREADASRVATLLQNDWAELVAREGTVLPVSAGSAAADADELPCPACGTAAPLVEGACSDCGLQLA
jgi:hypothetical protein